MATFRGQLRRTDDGGKTWQVVRSGVRVSALAFVSPARGYGLTPGGNLVATKDGGRSWAVLHSFHSAFVSSGGPESFSFPNGHDGWVGVGSHLFRTRDGGRSWERLRNPCSTVTFYVGGVSFLDRHRGYLLCGGQPATDMQAKDVYVSRDGGRTWRLRSCISFVPRARCGGRLPSIGHVAGLDFANPKVGLFFAGRGGIARTVDGGKRWAYTLFLDDEDDVVQTSWVSGTRVYALLFHRARLLRSDDAGLHWNRAG
jgi:photosystem II stability/assembly factor-like uncharacterized protein